MGILKTAAKVVGTATLSATWLASGILKTASDTAGFELGSELFGAGNEASASGIKRIWNADTAEVENDSEEDSAVAPLRKMKVEKMRAASKCREMASAARKAGNEEKHEQFMQRYRDLLEEAAAIDEQIAETLAELRM